MKRTFWIICFLAIPLSFIITSCKNQNDISIKTRTSLISRAEMQSVTEFLADDLLEGRAPGTRGGYLAENYMKSMFKYMDFEPGWDADYLQSFAMKGFTGSDLKLFANGIQLSSPKDITGVFTVEEQSVDFESEAIFVGFGIKTETWDWDDYKNIDVKDKIVITRVNDPGMIVPTIFEGDTLTYYGRWTYHIEEAARRGAAGVLLIHTDESAGYDWNVVMNSWSGEELYIPSQLDNNLIFRGWIQESSLKKILQTKGLDLDELYKNTGSRDFKPLNTGIKIRMSGKNTFRDVVNSNVVAEIPGKSEKRIVISAHIDHLGMDSEKQGDKIYNGAIDNASAIGAMMLVAKILKERQSQLNYSITILACNAEESGLLGSMYYAENTDRSNIIANINFESGFVWGETGSIMGIGARFSGFEALLKELAEENSLRYSEFSGANEGMFYRSDQFSFARYGIPGIWFSAGEDELSGMNNYGNYRNNLYHTVDDEYDPDWELEGMRQTVKYALLLIDKINKSGIEKGSIEKLPYPIE